VIRFTPAFSVDRQAPGAIVALAALLANHLREAYARAVDSARRTMSMDVQATLLPGCRWS
jgi:hypothetical protein